MKKTAKILISCIVLTMCIVFCYLSVNAAKVEFSEDFESSTIDEAPRGTWVMNGPTTGGDNSNKYAVLAGSDNGKNYTRMYKKLRNVLPMDTEVIVSVDFMIPGDVENANFTVIDGNLYDNAGCAYGIVVKGGVIYANTTGGNVNPTAGSELRTDLESGKWYNVFVVYCDRDCAQNPRTYKAYANGQESEVYSFVHERPNPNKEAQPSDIENNRVDYPWGVKNHNTAQMIYIDNACVAVTTHKELDIALMKARALLVEAEVGYENGEYPESVISMLRDVYNSGLQYAANEASEDEVNAYAENVMAAIEKANNSKIDTVNGIAGEAAYIKFRNNLISDSETGFDEELTAEVFDARTEPVPANVEWELTEGIEGVNLSGNRLTVLPGVRGEIVLKAAVGEIYLKQSVFIAPECKVTELALSGKDGKIYISASMDNIPFYDVHLSIRSAEDDSIIIDDIITFKDDKTFNSIYDIPLETSLKSMVASISGVDVITKTSCEPYYGQDWENTVLSKINDETSEETLGELLIYFSEGLGLDRAAAQHNKKIYAARLFCEGKDYVSFQAFCDAANSAQYVMKHYEVTRAEIADLILHNKELLLSNGFDSKNIAKLSESEQNAFYVDAALADVDPYTTTVKDICSKLMDIFNKINEKPVIKDDSSGVRISVGGGGGSKSYSIGLLEPKKEDDTDTIGTENEKTVEEFADSNETPWAAEALLFMRTKGIMDGDGNNVRPNDAVTRGEFAKILVTAFGLVAQNTGDRFSDSAGTWWEDYASAAADCGIVNGYGDGTFGGNAVMTREMLAVTIYRVVNFKDIKLYDCEKSVSFEDSDEISDYSRTAISYLTLKGIVSGVGKNLFLPKSFVTRAEAAQIVYNVMKQL